MGGRLMPGAFLYDNIAQSATLASNEANVPSMPLSNIQDPQPRRRVRLNSSVASIIADLGANRAVDCAALISTTLGAGATVRARIGNEAGIVEAPASLNLNFLQGALDSRLAFTRGSVAWSFNQSGDLGQSGNNVARFDHDPVTRERRGLLMEMARSNIALHSRDFTQAAWVKTNITTALDVTGINGVANSASRLTATAANGTALQTITSASANHVTSFFLRRINGTGTVEMTQNGGTTWTPVTLTSAWQRFVVPFATVTNPVIGIRLGVSGDVIAVDLAQTEAETFPTSPIITAGASVTRAVDNAVMSPVSSWFNPSEGTILLELSFPFFPEGNATAGTSDILRIDDGGINAFVIRMAGRSISATYLDALAIVAGATVFDSLNYSGFTANQTLRFALAYNTTQFATSFNGSVPATSATTSLPTGINRLRISGENGAAYIRRIAYYPTRLSNAQLIALTGTGSTLVPAEITGDTGIIAAEAEDANQGNVIMTLPAPAVGRYLRIDIENPTAAFTDIGVLAAGQLWRTDRSIAYGIDEGRLMLDRRDRNAFTGVEFPVPAVINPRYARFTLPVLSDNEVRNQHRELVRQLGAARDGLVIPDIADGLAERNRRALWGALNEPGGNAGTIMAAFNINERSFTVTERV
jgi:hypothetical protein